jgi:hypothetical protein
MLEPVLKVIDIGQSSDEQHYGGGIEESSSRFD